jgi:hypothetical protein
MWGDEGQHSTRLRALGGTPIEPKLIKSDVVEQASVAGQPITLLTLPGLSFTIREVSFGFGPLTP